MQNAACVIFICDVHKKQSHCNKPFTYIHKVVELKGQNCCLVDFYHKFNGNDNKPQTAMRRKKIRSTLNRVRTREMGRRYAK